MSTIPFTYFLYHKPTGKKYYGVRYKKGCHPSDLWTNYFSSSDIVEQMIIDYGSDSFDYEVRKIFQSIDAAKMWESKVQRRLRVDIREDWINQHIQSGKFRCTGHNSKTREKLSRSLSGLPKTEIHKKRISEKSLLDRQARRDAGWKMPRDAVEASIQWRKENYDSFYTEGRNRKMSASKTGTKRHYLPDGSFIYVKPVQQDQ